MRCPICHVEFIPDDVKSEVAKRKVGKKKIRKRIKRKPVYPLNYHLHAKKLEILRVVPIMPCSAISDDIHGLKFAHTQAEKVYQVYRRECESRNLVTRRIEGTTSNGTRPKFVQKESVWEIIEVPCVRFEGVWEICDKDSGEKETFGGSGDGDNNIWSANSAQTIAKKQALLDYFETAWPQPTSWLRVVRESLEELPPEEMVKAIKGIIPPKIAEATGIVQALYDYFESVMKGPKNGNRTGSKRKS